MRLSTFDMCVFPCAQFYANLYGIPVPQGQSDPDIFITLEVLGESTDVGLYCNPGWGQYADVNANYPQPGYAIWQSGAAPVYSSRHILLHSMSLEKYI